MASATASTPQSKNLRHKLSWSPRSERYLYSDQLISYRHTRNIAAALYILIFKDISAAIASQHSARQFAPLRLTINNTIFQQHDERMVERSGCVLSACSDYRHVPAARVSDWFHWRLAFSASRVAPYNSQIQPAPAITCGICAVTGADAAKLSIRRPWHLALHHQSA